MEPDTEWAASGQLIACISCRSLPRGQPAFGNEGVRVSKVPFGTIDSKGTNTDAGLEVFYGQLAPNVDNGFA